MSKITKFSFFVIIIAAITTYGKYQVLVSSFNNQTIGYDNCDMHTNGEYVVIREFIKPGDTVFDVGANVGDWSACVQSLHWPTYIYAFEPLVHLHANFRSQTNPQHCTVYPYALSNTKGTFPFIFYSKNQESSGMSGFYKRPIIEHHTPVQLEVPATTLSSFCDDQAINKIDFLKIDTEGAELLVLQGAEKLLANNAIGIIQFEYGGTYLDAKITLKQVYNLLSKYGYRVYRITSSALYLIENWHEGLECYRYSNYLAINNTRKIDI